MDSATAVLSTASLQFGTERDMVVAVETQLFLKGEGEELRGFCLLLPDAASLQVILRAVKLL